MPRSASQASSLGTNSAAAGTPGLEMMPMVLMTGIEEELLVAFRASDGTFHDGGFEAQAFHHVLDVQARFAMEFGRAHDAAFANLTFPHFKLWLDEYNHAARGAQNRTHCRQNQGGGDEADVKRGQVHPLADVFEPQIARVDALMHHDAFIVAQCPVELARAYVDGMHARNTTL